MRLLDRGRAASTVSSGVKVEGGLSIFMIFFRVLIRLLLVRTLDRSEHGDRGEQHLTAFGEPES